MTRFSATVKSGSMLSICGTTPPRTRASRAALGTGSPTSVIVPALGSIRPRQQRIVVLQAGRIAQDGAPEQLVRIPGAYRDLIRREMLRLSTPALADGLRAAP